VRLRVQLWVVPTLLAIACAEPTGTESGNPTNPGARPLPELPPATPPLPLPPAQPGQGTTTPVSVPSGSQTSSELPEESGDVVSIDVPTPTSTDPGEDSVTPSSPGTTGPVIEGPLGTSMPGMPTMAPHDVTSEPGIDPADAGDAGGVDAGPGPSGM